jgi:hypothetical protein
MKITGLDSNMGGNFNEIVANINSRFFTENSTGGGDPTETIDQAIDFAKDNVGDSILDPMKRDQLNALKPTEVWDGMKEMYDTAANSIATIWNDITGGKLPNLEQIFNDQFGKYFYFAKMVKVSDQKYKITIGDKEIMTLSSIEDFSKYITTMSLSAGSIMYHGKVKFGKDSGTKDKAYSTYFNILSWFMRTLSDKGKMDAVKGTQFPFVYMVTPFLLDTIKYSLRTYVNNIEEFIDLGSDLEQELKSSHSKSSMEEEEWKLIAEKLKQRIVDDLKGKDFS